VKIASDDRLEPPMKATILRERRKKRAPASGKKTATKKRLGTSKARPKLTLEELRALRDHFDLAGWNAASPSKVIAQDKVEVP
jgi:hypothetical protein